MKWSLKLGQVAGISIKLHWTFSLLLAWVFAAQIAAGETPVSAAEAVLLILLLFGCVVLHELGHALTARKFGIATRDITLLPIGGVARLERMPEKPLQEILVAIAGPAVNVAIASVLALFLSALVGFHHVFTATMLTETFFGQLLLVNILLVLFNMLPAFPMDGGRVLRAVLALGLDHLTATEVAARIGQFMAIGFGILGLYTNSMLIFVAIFVYLGAAAEAAQVRMKAMMNAVPVTAAMIRQFHSLHADDSLGTAAGELLSGSQQDFPVLAAGRFVGVLTRNDILNAITAGNLDISVNEAMHRDCPVAADTDLLEPVVAAMNEADCPTTPVTHDGRIVGVVTLENVGEWLAIQSALRRQQSVNETPRQKSLALHN